MGILHIIYQEFENWPKVLKMVCTYNITIPSGYAIKNCLYLSKAGALAKIESEHLDLWGVHLPTLNVAAIYRVK